MGKPKSNLKKKKERGFVSYFPKLAKKLGATARSDVHQELEKILYFALGRLTDAGEIILSDYALKCDTVRPKLIQAALMSSLHGNLKATAMQAGAEAVFSKFSKDKSKDAAKAKAKAGGDESTETAAVEA